MAALDHAGKSQTALGLIGLNSHALPDPVQPYAYCCKTAKPQNKLAFSGKIQDWQCNQHDRNLRQLDAKIKADKGNCKPCARKLQDTKCRGEAKAVDDAEKGCNCRTRGGYEGADVVYCGDYYG